MAEEKIHSLLGASSAHRFMACPGSVALIDQAYRSGAISRDASSAYADEGTRAHKLAEDILRAGLVAPSLEIVKSLDSELGKTKADEMLACVKTYVSDVWHAFNYGGPTERAGEIVFKVEHKLQLDMGEDLFCTCDCYLYKEATRTLWVWDYKHGAGKPVDAEGNVQLLYNALGALGELQGRVVSDVVLTIVQPRCDHVDGPVRRWEVSLLELLDFEDELRQTVELIKAGNTYLHAGKHCQFCPVKFNCPELHKNALMVAGDEFEVLEKGGIHTPLPEPSCLTSEELGKRLTFIAWLQVYAGGLYTYAMREAERGRCPEGWKLVEKRARRKWIDEEKARGEIVQSWGATNTLQLKSPAQVEKFVGKGKFSTYAERLVKAESSGLKLVPASDKAKAVACIEFEDLTSDGE